MNLLLTACAALLAAAWTDEPKTDVRTVRFPVPTLAVTRAKTGRNYFVHGPCRVDMSFAAGHVKKPLLRIVCLVEIDGELVWMDGLWDRPGTNKTLSRSDAAAAFKTAGRDSVCGEARCVSEVMPEVGVGPYQSASYGEADNAKGFFRLDQAGDVKLLIYRFEVWQAGVLAGVWESPRTGLGKYDIPPDWSVRGRHQRKFKYIRPR